MRRQLSGATTALTLRTRRPRRVSPGPARHADASARLPPAAGPAEIKVDEPTALKVTALEARMSAVLANDALLQRQAQDLQQEMSKLIEEREDTGRPAGTPSAPAR